MGSVKLKRRKAELCSLIKRLARGAGQRKKYLRTAAVIMTIAAALLFFGRNGENSPIDVIRTGTDDSFALSYKNEPKAVKPVQFEKTPDESELICCDIGGAVAEPGVYSIPKDSRLYELIDKAGGLTEDADTSRINRALVLADGAMIRIPSAGGADQTADSSGVSWYVAGDATWNEAAAEQEASGGLININAAGPEELQKLPGIGPVIAERIIEYREKTGPFSSIEEIRSVKGIGDKTFEKMKDHICC